VIQLGVIEAVQEMDGARTRRSEADSDLAGEFGMATGHEGGLFLMPHLHKLDGSIGPTQRGHDPIDAVSWVSKDAVDTPLLQAGEKEIADGLDHGELRC
jgi:hypothetical protein